MRIHPSEQDHFILVASLAFEDVVPKSVMPLNALFPGNCCCLKVTSGFGGPSTLSHMLVGDTIILGYIFI